MDPKTGTVTVRMKDKNGKEQVRDFKLTEDIRYFDSEGHAATIDLFRSGNEVLVVEREGKLVEMQRNKKGTTNEGTGKTSAETKPGGK